MNSLRLKNKKSSPQEFALIVGIILFAILIVRTNYSGNAFYNFDMYSDQLYARLVSEEGTVFPSDWVFGNQYYVIATPVLAGLLNTLIHNSFISMATASTLMFLLTLAVFAWSFYPFLDRLSLLVAMFCLSGAAVLGGLGPGADPAGRPLRVYGAALLYRKPAGFPGGEGGGPDAGLV